MKSEEAIGRIQEHIRIHSKKEPFTPYLDKAFYMAIEALETHDELCENLAWYINERQRLLKVIEYSKPNEGLQRTIRKALERPHGEWEHWGSPFTDDTIANSIVCSICKARYVEIEGEVFNLCPKCGADMTEGGDDGCPNRS